MSSINMDNIEINPCKATLNHLKKTGYSDYNNVNNLCYETCYNWFGSGSNTSGTKCYKNCDACVTPFVYARGQTTCSFKPRPPPVFTHPAYFKDLYLESGSKSIAIKQCKDMCEKYDSGSKQSCKLRCDIDSDALVDKEQFVHVDDEDDSDSTNDYSGGCNSGCSNSKSTFDDYAKANPAAFYTTFSIISIILAIFLGIFIWVLVTN